VQKWWSIFFGVVLAATFGLWVVAPLAGWWLPPNVADYGDQVDGLFYVILGFTGFFFLLTEIILVYVMWRYAHREGRKADYTHGNHKLEIFWTAVPAAILLFIAFAQVKAWENIKYQSRMPPPDMTVQVTARQWEWRMRHPFDTTRFNYSADTEATQAAVARREALRWAEAPEFDDIHVANELHTWQGANVKIYLKTLDVLHSFYLPNLRLKQDALPGKTIPMWFRATLSNTVPSDLPGEWLGNKDPQRWRDELRAVRRLNEEAGKREQLAQKDKDAAAKDQEAVAKDKEAAGSKDKEAAKNLRAEAEGLRAEATKLRAEAGQLTKDVAKLAEVRKAQGEGLEGVPDERLPGELRARAADVRYTSHRTHAWEIACAELCGGRHAYMKGRLYVHPNREGFEAWLAHAYRQQHSRKP
jgi:cytochrome c oxidase subunit 2